MKATQKVEENVKLQVKMAEIFCDACLCALSSAFQHLLRR